LSEPLIIALAGVLIQMGILVATLRFLGQRLEEHRRETHADLNGLGKKERAIMAELIIQSKDHPEFSVIVRKLINGI
jgi:hypothetical protein